MRQYSKRVGTDVHSETEYTYDSMGRVTLVTDPLNRTVETHYDDTTGFADWVENAKNHRTTMVTDVGYGRPTTITDANGNVTTVQYDEYGRTDKVWRPTEPTSGPATQKFSYTLATANSHAMTESEQLAETSPNVYLGSFDFYDGFGRVVQSQSAAEGGGRIVTSRTYSERGALRRESFPHHRTGTAGSGYVNETWTGSSPDMPLQTVYTVDDLDRVEKTETIADDSAPNVLWTNTASFDGQTQTSTDRMGVELDYVYDVFGNLRTVTEYDDGDLLVNGSESAYTTTYHYDTTNRLTRAENSKSGTGDDITITYDMLGRKLTMADPDMGNWSYTYDKNGNLKTQNDGRGEVLWFSYDNLNRPIYQRDTSSTGDRISQWAYDKTGELGLLNWSKAFENDVERVRVNPLGYDARGRVTSTKWNVYGDGSGDWTVSQTYDEADRVETLTYPTGEVVTYEYSNTTGQPESLSTNQGNVIVAYATWTDTGQPLTQEWGSGTANIFASWEYKADSQRLFKIKADKDGATGTDLALLRYHYDLAGNITQLKDARNSGQVQCFYYDDLRRLKTAYTSNDDSGTSNDCSDGYDNLGTGAYHHTWVYDRLGNITSWTDVVDSNTESYGYGAGSAGPHAVTAFDGGTYAYDGNGNQRTRPTGDTLTFDVANRLVAYNDSGAVTTFSYDADGGRVVRDEGSNETVYIGGVFEKDDNTERTYYQFAGQTVAYDLDGAGSADGRYYLISDHLGTNSHQLKYGATTPARSSQYYLPFGGTRGGSGLDTERGYTGQVSDASQTGLLFYNARYYDPLLRRFVSADVMVPNAGNPQDLNRYSYVRNNPVLFADPTGHFSIGGFFKGAGNFVKGVGSGLASAASTTVHMVTNPKETASAMANAWSSAYTDGGGGFSGVFSAAKATLVDPIVETAKAGYAAAKSGDWETLGNLSGEVLFEALVARGAGRIFRRGGPSGNSPGPSGGCPNSFTGDTLVTLADGTQIPIAEIEEGDVVWATDPETGFAGAREVIAVIVGVGDKDLVTITTEDREVIVATAGHPIWETTTQTWRDAGDLVPGHTLDPLIGDDVAITAVRYETVNTVVYNLTVIETHTYHAGNNELLVHNCGDVPSLRDFADSQRSAAGRNSVQYAAEYTSPSGARYLDVNGHGRSAPSELQSILDEIPHHGGCAEVGCLIQAIEAEGFDNALGGSMRTVRVFNEASSRSALHGTAAAACSRCATLMGRTGIQ